MTGGDTGTTDRPARKAGPLPDVPRIRLRASTGVVIDYTLPLHESINHQWLNGDLSRVGDDGVLYTDNEHDLSDAYARGSETAGEGDKPGGDAAVEPPRPADSAPKKAWQDYAVLLGAATSEEAAAMTKPDLVARCTPPEIDPLKPKE